MGIAADLKKATLVKAADRSPIVRKKREQAGRASMTDKALESARSVVQKLDDERLIQASRDRIRLLEECEKGATAQLREIDRCRADFTYWLTWYGWTFDPRHVRQKTVPFIPWGIQPEFIAWIHSVNAQATEGVIDKSRDMGATWVLVAYFVWRWLFEPEFVGLFASRKVEAVDEKANPSSIMEKARIMIRNLPDWMTPRGFVEKFHAVKLRIVNPATGAILKGEGGKQVGRSGRASAVLVDEAAHLENFGAAESALSAVADVKFWLSTPNLPGDGFARKRFSKDFPTFSLHWLTDPTKNGYQIVNPLGEVVGVGSGAFVGTLEAGNRIVYPWFETMRKKLGRDPVKIAREVNIDYTAATDAIVFQFDWIRAATMVDLGEVEGITEGGLDLSGSGPDDNVLTLRTGPFVLIQKPIVGKNSTIVARSAFRLASEFGVRVLHYDAGGGYGVAVHGEYESGGVAWPFDLNGVTGSGNASRRLWGEVRAKALFTNRRTELFFQLAERFRKSYELWLFQTGQEGGEPWPPEECISIPDDPRLIDELTLILFDEKSDGRRALEPKEDLLARTQNSPDFADSLAYSFAPVDEAIGTVTVTVGGAR